MKKIQLLAAVLVLVIAGLTFGTGGNMGTHDGYVADGSESSPYLIEDLADFQAFCGNESYWERNVHTRLDADIDLSSVGTYTKAPISPNSPGSPGYNGTFDGNHHVVRNLTLESSGTTGLFGVTSFYGRITHLGVENVLINGRGDITGGLVGFHEGALINCYTTGTVNNLGEDTGGLVGMTHGEIIDSYSAVAVSNRGVVGGLAGFKGAGVITRSYATGSVTGTGGGEIGGLVGECWNPGQVSDCYATGAVTGPSSVGGLIGSVSGSSTATTGCFWDVETSGLGAAGDDNFGATGKTTAQMRSFSTFVDAGWDFDTVWRMREGIEYPQLYVALPYAGGDGSLLNPFKIATAGQLNDLRQYACDWGKHFILTADIDLTGFSFDRAVIAYDTNAPTTGFEGTSFTGVFDGNDHIIRNLTVDGRYYCGLFGQTGSSSSIKNLGIRNISVNGSQTVGGLVGWNNGSITDCFTAGTVSSSVAYVGGLVSSNRGSITNCYSTASISAPLDFVGGLVSSNRGSVTNCYSTGAISGGGIVGGLVGDNRVGGVITSCFWDVETSNIADPEAGNADTDGMIGQTTAQMKSQSTFTAAGWDFDAIWWISEGLESPQLNFEFVYAGGNGTALNPFEIATAQQLNAIGDNPDDWDKHFILTADIDMTGFSYSRAVIAYDTSGSEYFEGTAFSGVFDGNNHTISNLSINGAFSFYCGLFGQTSYGSLIKNLGIVSLNMLNNGYYVGALAGENGGNITSCYSTGTVSGYTQIGGLVGSNSGRLTECYSGCSVNGDVETDGDIVGGLVGDNSGTITNSHADGYVTGADYIGALVGNNQSTILQCYSAGSANGYNHVGGLVGRNESYYASVTNCYSTGSVAGSTRVGGLVGYNYGKINTSYSSCRTSGGDYTGGLAGVNGSDGQVTNSYATGVVSGRDDIGGLVGVNNPYGNIANCYSTGPVSGRFYIGGLVGVDAYDSSVTSCFWDVETSGVGSAGDDYNGAIGKTTAQMKTRSTFTTAGWDFVNEGANGTDDIWRLCVDGADYPGLRWKYWQSGDIECPNGVSLEDLMLLVERWLGAIYRSHVNIIVREGFGDNFRTAWMS